MQTCEAYGKAVCTDPQYTKWVQENCCMYCMRNTFSQSSKSSIWNSIGGLPARYTPDVSRRPDGNTFSQSSKSSLWNSIGGQPARYTPDVSRRPDGNTFSQSSKSSLWNSIGGQPARYTPDVSRRPDGNTFSQSSKSSLWNSIGGQPARYTPDVSRRPDGNTFSQSSISSIWNSIGRLLARYTPDVSRRPDGNTFLQSSKGSSWNSFSHGAKGSDLTKGNGGQSAGYTPNISSRPDAKGSHFTKGSGGQSAGYIPNISSEPDDTDATLTSSQPNECGTEADIVFVLDSSASVRESNFKLLLSFVNSLTKDWDIGPDSIRVGVEKFSVKTNTEFHLNQFNDKQQLMNATNNIKFNPGTTNTADALRHLKDVMFKSSNGDRPGVPNIAIIITDGKSNNVSKTKTQAEAARKAGIALLVMGVGKGISKGELQNITGQSDRVFVAKSFFEMGDIKAVLQEQTCRATDASQTPSQPNGNENFQISTDKGGEMADLSQASPGTPPGLLSCLINGITKTKAPVKSGQRKSQPSPGWGGLFLLFPLSGSDNSN
ncbi:uncharacterized protein [Littorina saxatilis]|uniref:uncharacterized protein isoform X2 n=1 Tax=Littorina saxatilis TaxID=31220 RepID=UPI0038B4681A